MKLMNPSLRKWLDNKSDFLKTVTDNYDVAVNLPAQNRIGLRVFRETIVSNYNEVWVSWNTIKMIDNSLCNYEDFHLIHAEYMDIYQKLMSIGDKYAELIFRTEKELKKEETE